MFKSRASSRIEVWKADYIDFLDRRSVRDRHTTIVQIEHATGKDYIVEVVDDEEED